MFGNPQIPTHFYIYIYICFFSEAVFLFYLSYERDLRSNFAYKPNETPVIQRKKKKEKNIKRGDKLPISVNDGSLDDKYKQIKSLKVDKLPIL